MTPTDGSPKTNHRRHPHPSACMGRHNGIGNGRRGEEDGVGVPMEASSDGSAGDAKRLSCDNSNGNFKRRRCPGTPPRAADRWCSQRAASSDIVDLTSVPDFDDDRDQEQGTRRDGRDDASWDVVDLTSPDENCLGDRKIEARGFWDDGTDAARDSGTLEQADESPDERVRNCSFGRGEGDGVIVAGPPSTRNAPAVASSSSGKRSRCEQMMISLLDSSDDDDDADDVERARKLVRTSESEELGPTSIAPSNQHLGIQDPRKAVRTASPHRTTASASAAAAPSPFATTAPELLDSVQHSLTHDKKLEHFDDARRPERRLQREIDNLYAQRPVGRPPNTPNSKAAHVIWQQQMDELQAQLHETRKNAARDIFNRNNSAGTMGRIGADGELVFDFHGFYVRDAISHFDESLLPILPVQNEVRIITGKGKHSGNGRSLLRDGLVAHIQQCSDYRKGRVRCHIDPRNAGRIVVRWIDGA